MATDTSLITLSSTSSSGAKSAKTRCRLCRRSQWTFAVVVAGRQRRRWRPAGSLLRQVAVVEDLDHLDLQRLAAVFDAELDADMVGIDQFLGGLEEMHQREFQAPHRSRAAPAVAGRHSSGLGRLMIACRFLVEIESAGSTSTRETVAEETPTAEAISLIVTMSNVPLPPQPRLSGRGAIFI